MSHDFQIQKILSDKNLFNETVYTDIYEAVKEMKERWNDKELETRINKYLNNDIPGPYKEGFKLVLGRDLYTPNFEVHRFISIVDALGLKAVFGEYHHDKFTTNNKSKYHYGKMIFYEGTGRNGGIKTKHRQVVDFSENDGKKIKDIRTTWGEPLIDFHRDLFLMKFNKFAKDSIFDISDWMHRNGGDAEGFYKKFLALFIRHGILFENYLLDKGELNFTKKVFLPAFLEVSEKIGKKPLIVALEPTDIEGDKFWLSYPPDIIKLVDSKSKHSLK